MIIDRLPPFTQCFFRSFKDRLSRRQYRHLWSLVLAMVVNLRAAKLLHLSAATPEHSSCPTAATPSAPPLSSSSPSRNTPWPQEPSTP